MKRILVMLLSLVVIFSGTLFAKTLKIGFNVPLTGFAAADGESALNGAKLAVKQVNEAGGVRGYKLDLVVYDDQASPKEAVPIAIKLITKDKVIAGVSGSYSGATRAAASVFQSHKIPYISAYAIHPGITRAGDYVFRTSFLGEVEGRAGAKLIGDILKKKRVVIITLKNDFGKSLSKGFRSVAAKYGIEIINEYEYSIKDRQFGSIVAKVKADNPDAIYASGYYFTAGPLVAQLRTAGINVPIIGQEGYDSEKFIEIAGKYAEGVIITTSLDRDSKEPETRSFIDEYIKMTGKKPDMVAASTHTAIKVIAYAIEHANSLTPKDLRDAIANAKVKASTGTISFNKLGEVFKDVQVQIVKNGEWHHFAVISDPEILTPPSE
ncbi:branched-chain amino acid ABC transporter, substrate-binding protein [Deferribacter desulfuricans SSM1]|uniref:Branched-chain amino acid ABC transporter, substrate-binding protein n=1 Tax=Deferribacter desulfuricans (strain DSM 14783 / JCM 11476 / NBRC 101012 / SSM1) TaxID=639282 RepID=D3PCS7_DEFDS|nr:ABC transporter substrate-binding protein [Deferribacter desulfuricans]BAI80400.1 branched-chain amino acid ABC transporter, substrate-binding protein [Deferribacter desulfuricans SSM1]